MLSLIRENVAVIQAILALASIVVAVLLYIIARQQTQARRLDAFREYLREHHSREMRELRRIVRSDLIEWLKGTSNNADFVPGSTVAAARRSFLLLI